jgi:hypothetical protein
MARNTSNVDLGLAISGALLRPGERRQATDIAAFCGCSPQNIRQLETRALKKLRNLCLFGPPQHRLAPDDIPQLPTDRMDSPITMPQHRTNTPRI